MDKKFICSLVPHEKCTTPRLLSNRGKSFSTLVSSRPPTAQELECLQVRKEVNREMAKIFAWSFKCCIDGVWPAVGFYGEEFVKRTARSRDAGKPFDTPWRSLVCKVSQPRPINQETCNPRAASMSDCNSNLGPATSDTSSTGRPESRLTSLSVATDARCAPAQYSENPANLPPNPFKPKTLNANNPYPLSPKP